MAGITFMNISKPQANRLLDFSPVSAGIDSMGNALQYREQMDYRKQQDAKQEARANAASGRAAESHKLAMEDAKEAKRRVAVERAAGLMQMVDEEQDVVKRGDLWKKVISGTPLIGETLSKYGIDPNDAMMGPKFILRETRGYLEPKAEDQPKVMEVGGRLVRVGPNGTAEEIYSAGPDATKPEKEGATMQERALMLEQAGIDRNSPEGRRFLLQGDMGRSEGMMAGDRAAIRDADLNVTNYDFAIDKLDRALQLNSVAGSGIGTSTSARLRNTTGLATDQSRAAAELENILSKSAVQEMSQTLKGATTDRELFYFIEMAGDVSLDPQVRSQYINAAKQKLVKLRELAARQADEIRGGTYYGQPGRAAAPPASGPPPAGPATRAPPMQLPGGFTLEVE